ncbi:hypothetical protein HDU98_007667 [Podochytrium sp. JEL0797]|nr:hypothetical protein HDU98_007667 [Podochytrium sp. JEL0797]
MGLWDSALAALVPVTASLCVLTVSASSVSILSLLVLFQGTAAVSLWLWLPGGGAASAAVAFCAAFALLNTLPTKQDQAYQPIDHSVSNPKPALSLYGILMFSFMSPIMKRGTEQKITADDLYDLDKEFTARHLFFLFESGYRAFDGPTTDSLVPYFRALIPFFDFTFFIAWVFVCVSLVFELIQPKLIEWILGYLTDETAPLEQGYRLVAAVFVVAVLSPPAKEQYFNVMLTTGIRLRTAIQGAVYQKALRLSPAAKQQFTQGYIQTLQSVDADTMTNIPRQLLNGVFKANVQLAVVFWMLFQQIGWAFLPGFLIVVVSSPIQVQFTNRSGAMDKKRLEAMDQRIRLMGETLKGMLVVKFNCLEGPLQHAIKTLRFKEMQSIRFSLVFESLGDTVWKLQPFLIALSCFGTYMIVLGNTLTPQKTFTTLALLRLMNQPMNWLRRLFINSKKVMVSARRIDAFLKAEEIQEVGQDETATEGYVRVVDKAASEDGFAVVVRNANAAWNSEQDTAACVQVENLDIKKGELLAIVGRTGEGKSSLVSMLLGEMYLQSGLIKVYGPKIAYVSQSAWILSGTLRSNILLGEPYNELRYMETLTACSLHRDLSLLPAGDLTEIGERGINLSGGQRQRISLARAVYANADIYLFDDPLSALDAHVGRHVFQNVVGKEGVLKDKTRVLVTHGIHYLPAVDRIWVVKDGRVVETGTYDALVGIGGRFAKLAKVMEADGDKMRAAELSGKEARDARVEEEDEEATSVETVAVPQNEVASPGAVAVAKTAGGGQAASGQLTSEEEQMEGSVGWDAYRQYATAFSVPGLILCLVLSSVSNGLAVSASWWLGIWSAQSPADQIGGITYYFGVYSIIVTIVAVCSSVYTYIFRAVYALRAATILHDNILAAIMQAPMSFFDATPTGRILNRFSKDMDTLCDSLPVSFCDAMIEFVIILTGFAACTLATPVYILFVLPLSVPYVWLQKRYLGTSRDLRRLYSITRSPIFQLLSESLDGLPTLRSFGLQKEFVGRLEDMIDLNNNAYITNLCSSRWFDVRIDTVGLMTLFISAALCVASKGVVDPGLAGLALIYASSNAGYLSWFVQDFCLLEVNIVSVERINEYVDCPQEIKGNQVLQLSPEWPSGGNLEFKGYSTRYRPGLDLVLQNLTLSIRAGERVGIVGRTGSGKSSLVLALMRILEAAEGMIELDGVNVAELELENLRRQITVVPQEPVLFASTIRENLDPFGEKEDVSLWDALEKTRMKDWAQQQTNGLDSLVSEVSVGERQLLCMAKALLQKAVVLVLDEATSSIDIRTDELIQKILREEFTNSSILCIAHRINTILDYDKILVLSNGRIAEFDTPNALLSNPDSVFAGLCQDHQDI